MMHSEYTLPNAQILDDDVLADLLEDPLPLEHIFVDGLSTVSMLLIDCTFVDRLAHDGRQESDRGGRVSVLVYGTIADCMLLYLIEVVE
jgi:hypothetical protein